MKRRRLLILLFLALPVFVFLLLEVVFRVGEEPLFLPSREVRLHNDIPGFAQEVQWQSDGLGLRKINWEQGSPRVLCLGGPSTQPLLQSDADSWWGQMQGNLAAKGIPLAVAATGSPAGDCTSGARWFRTLQPKLLPDLVILVLGPGEVLARPPGYRHDPEGATKLIVPPSPQGWKAGVLNVSAVARRWRSARMNAAQEERSHQLEAKNVIRDRLAENHADFSKAPRVETPWVHDPGTELSAVLSGLGKSTKEKGVKLLVVWLPWPHRPDMSAEDLEHFRFVFAVQNTMGDRMLATPDPGWVDGRLKAFRTRAAAVCEGRGIAYFDAASAVGNDPACWYGDFQLNDKGAKAVGVAVAGAVEKILQEK